MTAPTLFEQEKSPTAGHMVELLRAHYLAPNRAPAGIFAPEIEAPGGKRRADLIWQGCTRAAGRELVGHEVKVTRPDLLAELADGSKSDPWQRYCDRWWLVVPDRSIINDVDLPATWGVMLPPSGRHRRSMTVLVPAPQLHPDDQAPALRTLATWLHWRHTNTLTEVAQRDRDIQRLQGINERLNEDLDELGARTPLQQQRQEQIVAEIVRRLGDVDYEGRIGDWTGRVTTDDVVAALTDHKTLNQRARDLGHTALSTVRDLRRLLTQIDRGQLDKLEADARGLATMKGGEDGVSAQDDELRVLRAEVARLRDEAADTLVRQTALKGMTVEAGAAYLELGPPRELVIAWVHAAREMLGDAANYSETRIDFPAASMEFKAGGEYERYVFTVQRAGKLTPHEARKKAETEVERLRALLAEHGIDDQERAR